MLELFIKGGPVMYPIAFAGVLGLAIFLERIFSLRRERVIPSRLIKAVMDLIGESKFSEAGVLCEQDRSAVSVILFSGIKNVGKSRERLKEFMQESGKSVAADLERYVAAVGTIAGISPLMGLLGTVMGMIRVFQRVTSEGVGDPRLLATGIWEALTTTAAGLIVAIPMYIIYRYLLGRVDRIVLEMEEIALNVADNVAEKG